MDWERLFKPHILERGFDYYENGFIEDYCEEKGLIQATVLGNSECAYDVNINVLNGKIIGMGCDCPYAQDGHNCKHMAAVLFYMEKEKIEESLNSYDNHKLSPNSKVNTRELVEKADEIIVKEFLTEVLENDDKLLSRFKNIICCDISEADMLEYKNRINKIFYKYAGRQNFINYYNAGPFIMELYDFLENDIEGMINSKKYKEAFDLVGYIFVKSGSQDMDDSDGETSVLAEQCLEIWQRIFKNSDMDLKRFMFQWFKETLNGRIIDYMEEYIEQILFEVFKEDEFLKDKLIFIKEKLNTYKENTDSFSYGYYAGKWILQYIDIMKELNESNEKITEYVKENLEFSEVRKYYIDECVRNKRYDEAIHLLEDGKEMSKDSKGLVSDYSLQLKELYKKTRKMEDYEKELWLLMLQFDAGNIDIYRELKTLYSEREWEEKREEIFNKLSSHINLDKLYKEDHMYDMLLKSVLNSNGLYKLMEYEKYLKKLYPNELLTKYENILNNMTTYASDRKQYRELVEILNKMKKYPGGAEKVNEIVCRWKSEYKTRRAMMEELSKL